MHYVQLLMIGWAGWWTWTPSTTLLQPKKWNACFWIMLNFWWLAGLVDGLESHAPCLSSQKILKCSSLDYVQLLIISLGWSMDSNPICHPSPARKMKCFILDYVQLLMIGWAGWWTQTPSATMPLQPEKLKCSCFGLRSTSDDWPGWSMDSQTPSATPLQPGNMEMLIFGLRSTSDDRPWAGRWTQTLCNTPLQPE